MKRDRIPQELFRESGHYVGRPADFGDKIVERRIELVCAYPEFTGKDLSLLDIGCGNGASLVAMCSRMKSCQGIDIEEANVNFVSDFIEKNDIKNCSVDIVDIDITVPKKLYDRVISFEVIEHLCNEKSISYYYDSLLPGGLMAISVPNKWWIFETHGAKLPLLPWNRVPFFSWLPRPIHERFSNARIYTRGRILKLLRDAGFEPLESLYVTAPMDVLPDGAFKRFVVNNFFSSDTTKIPFKSTSILVIARRPNI